MVSPDIGEDNLECNSSVKLTAGKHRANGKKLDPPCPSLGFTANGTRAAHAEGSRDQCCHKSKAVASNNYSRQDLFFWSLSMSFFRDPESGNAHEQQGQVVS